MGQQRSEEEVETRHREGKDKTNKHFVTFGAPTVSCLFAKCKNWMWKRCPPNVLDLVRKSFCEMFENWKERKTWEHLEGEVCAGMSLRNVPLVRGCEEMKHIFSIVMFSM